MRYILLSAAAGLVLAGCVATGPEAGSASTERSVHSFSFPNTPAAYTADAYLRDYSGDVMVRHTKRAYLFAKGFAEAEGLTVDMELLYVAITLHDLGLEERFEGPGNFETNGAKAARAYLTEQGFADLANEVETAIAIHTDVKTAGHPRAEFALVHRGSLADVTGSGLDKLSPAYIASVVEAFPRRGTKDLLITMLEHQATTKPNSAIGQTYARVPVSKLIRNAPFTD